MVERRRVLRWAASTEPTNYLESLRTSDEMFGAEGRPIHALEKAQSDLDLWFSLANSTYFPVLMRQLRESLSGSESLAADSEIRESNLRSRNIRENMLEEHFDLTPERIKEIFEQVSQGEKIQTAQQLMEGLSRIGVTCSDLAPLSSAFDLVGRRSGPGCHSGMHADELDVILSRVKLAQLLGRGEGSVSWSVPSGRLTLVDYTMQDAVMQDLQAEKLLHFFFGHRSHSSSFGKGPVQRWLHLRGCHLMLLMALTVKYRLSPLGVEDIIEQGPTKVDQHGVNIFITLDQLYVKNSGRLGVAPVQIGSSHVTLILSAPHRPDTLITVVQPSRNVHKDWPSEVCRVDSHEADDTWVEVLRQRLKRTRSRLAEHDVRYLGLQIVQLCVDNLVSVVRAFSARLVHLDQELQERSQRELDSDQSHVPPASWLSEVSLIRLQLAVVSRRLRNARNMLRRLEGMVPGDASLESRLSGYLQDVSDDVDGSLEDANHLTEKCNELSNAYDAALNREQSSQRRVAKEAERIEQVKQNRHAQKLNDILFVLTTATALFAPVQFLAGVYGMNFAIDGDPTMPELKWEYGYLYFWIVVIAYLIASGTLAVRLFRTLRIKQDAGHLLRNRQGTFSTLAGDSPRILEGATPVQDDGSSSPYHPLTG
ncbi:Putative metal ion transporter YfjQ [Durusdinium trenchii]|uniref:Metal ion transporter YfjQ n=1 Tax=Durusdinium trenchii TaxID=1381693 RepID=A0ABP0RY85_9DINO